MLPEFASGFGEPPYLGHMFGFVGIYINSQFCFFHLWGIINMCLVWKGALKSESRVWK